MTKNDSGPAFPKPWHPEWIGDGPPRVFAADGSVVCVVSTGTLRGAYAAPEVLAVLALLAKAGGEA